MSMTTQQTLPKFGGFFSALRRKAHDACMAERLRRQPKWLRDTPDDDLFKVGLTREALLKAVPGRCGVL